MVSVSGIAAVFFSWARGIAVGVGLEVLGVDVALVVVGEGAAEGAPEVLGEAVSDGEVAEFVVSGASSVKA